MTCGVRLLFSTGSVGIELKYNTVSSKLLASVNTGASACLLQLASVLSVEHHHRLLWLKLSHGCAYNQNPAFLLNLPDLSLKERQPFILDSSHSNARSQNSADFSPSQHTPVPPPVEPAPPAGGSWFSPEFTLCLSSPSVVSLHRQLSRT